MTPTAPAISASLGAAVGPVVPVAVESYHRDAMHAPTHDWPQTNCSIDLWIELLHSLGHDPAPAGACALAADMRGDQWLFLKFPIEDLGRLYGVTVDELVVWRPMLEHLVEHMQAGRLLTIEVDGWFLPDTAGVSYGIGHTKTTIVPNVVDPVARRLEYFHNDGYFALDGDDFDGVFRVDEPVDGERLPPYVEVVQTQPAGEPDQLTVARELATRHLAARGSGNPVERLGERIRTDLPWLAVQDLATFHVYAFAMVRQCGASAQVAADFVRWLIAQGEPGLAAAAEAFSEVSSGAKTLQFQLARAARGRSVSLDATLAAMSDAWIRALDGVAAWAP